MRLPGNQSTMWRTTSCLELFALLKLLIFNNPFLCGIRGRPSHLQVPLSPRTSTYAPTPSLTPTHTRKERRILREYRDAHTQKNDLCSEVALRAPCSNSRRSLCRGMPAGGGVQPKTRLFPSRAPRRHISHACQLQPLLNSDVVVVVHDH